MRIEEERSFSKGVGCLFLDSADPEENLTTSYWCSLARFADNVDENYSTDATRGKVYSKANSNSMSIKKNL